MVHNEVNLVNKNFDVSKGKGTLASMNIRPLRVAGKCEYR